MPSSGLKDLILDIVEVHSTFQSCGELPTGCSKLRAKFKVLQHDGQSFLVINDGVRPKLERNLRRLLRIASPR